LPCGKGTLQEIDPFLELLELVSELRNIRVGRGGDWGPTLYSLRQRASDRTQDLDEDPADGDKATKVKDCEVVHDSPPLR
jgi:hypothetical protein